MLIAAVRTGHALAGKAITYSDDDGRFWMTGAGEISAAQLIAYDERRELDWADAVTREWALEMAAVLGRKQAAEEQKQAAEAAAAAAEAARLEALAPPSVVYPPPDTTPPRPEGIPAVSPGFELAGEARDRPARWVVWAEAAPTTADVSADAEAPAGEAQALAAGAEPAVPASGPAPGASSPAAPQPLVVQAAVAEPRVAQPLSGPTASAEVPSQAMGRDRTPAPRRSGGRRTRSSAGLRIAVYVLVGVAAAAALYVAQRGGF